MSTQKDFQSNLVLENIDQENNFKKSYQEYKEFLEKHNMNKMNFPFVNFLRKAEILTMAEEVGTL